MNGYIYLCIKYGGPQKSPKSDYGQVVNLHLLFVVVVDGVPFQFQLMYPKKTD